MAEKPYNPLDKINLGRSIESELLGRPPIPLTSCDALQGAGVYAIYYSGDFKPYEPVRDGKSPIYAGKAIPQGGRKGGIGADASKGRALANRLKEHTQSINQVGNLNTDDFFVRYLVVDDIWIPLGENILIERFKPLWNSLIDGFGNHAPGGGRGNQAKSSWDTLHPGRGFAAKLPDNVRDTARLEKEIAEYLAGRSSAELEEDLRRVQDSGNGPEDA